MQITGRQAHKRNEYILMLLKNNSMARCVLIAADELGVPLLDAAQESSPRRRPAEVSCAPLPTFLRLFDDEGGRRRGEDMGGKIKR